MAEVIATYRARVSGLWNTRHTISNAEEELGVLAIERNGKGTIVRGTYTPKKGEVLHFRRDPGLLRSQESRCGHRTGVDVLLGNFNSQLLQFPNGLQRSPLAVVGHEHEGNILFYEPVYKKVCAGDQFISAVDDTIHIDQ